MSLRKLLFGEVGPVWTVSLWSTKQEYILQDCTLVNSLHGKFVLVVNDNFHFSTFTKISNKSSGESKWFLLWLGSINCSSLSTLSITTTRVLGKGCWVKTTSLTNRTCYWTLSGSHIYSWSGNNHSSFVFQVFTHVTETKSLEILSIPKYTQSIL